MQAGIYKSLLLKNKACKESMSEVTKKMGKKASLRYKASREGFSSEVLWEKCKGQKETIVLVETDQNSVIGGYCPDQWQDTTGMKSSKGYFHYKDITSEKPFLFYFLDDKIQIIKHKDDVIPTMSSD